MNFRGKSEPRSRTTRRGKRGKQQRSGLGFPLKQAKNREAEKAQSFSAPILEIFRLTALYFRPNRTAKKACQTRKDAFLSRGAYFAYVTKKKDGLTKYHAPYLRRSCGRKIKGKEAEKAQNFSRPYPRDFSLNIKRSKTAILRALPLKCGVRIFRTSVTCRASEGGKSEFLRVRRAQDLDTLPQKERKPRLKKTILRRNRVPPQRAMVRYIRGVVFEWRGCRSKSEKSRGRKSSKLFHPHPRDFSLILGKCRQVAQSAPASAPRRARRRRRRAWARKKVPKGG